MTDTELDIPHLSSFCSLPQTSLQTLLDSPTVELVRDLLQNISSRATEYDDLKSEKLRLDVELENAVRGGGAKARVLKASIEKRSKEVSDLKEKLEAERHARATIESEFNDLKASTSISTAESSTLKTRIVSLESSNRDTLSLLESKTTAYDVLREELSAQHQKIVDLRREVSSLEQAVQSASAASSSAKFREQGLQQENEYLKKNNEWLDNELKTKNGEHAKYRKEKGLRISELQRQNDDSITTVEALQRTESILRTRLQELGQKADDALAQIQSMQEEAAQREESNRVELDAGNRLAELYKNSADTERKRQQELQSELEQAREDASEEIGRANAEIETEHQERELSERRVAELEVQVDRLETDLAAARAQRTEQQGINGHAYGTPSREGSPARRLPPTPSRVKGGLSVTQMYSEFNDLKAEVDAEKRRNEKLVSTIEEMIQDMESRQPEIEDLRTDHARLESEVVELSALLDGMGRERDQAVKGVRKNEGRAEALAREGEVLRQQLRDLSSQIKVLLMEAHVGELDAEEHRRLEQLARGDFDEEALGGMTDTDKFISENLATFKNVSELQEQNNNLLRLTRELGMRMEHEEAQRKTDQAARDRDELMSLREKYERCKDEIKSVVTQSQSYIRERDMFRRMVSHRGPLPPDGDLASMFGESVNGEPPSTPGQDGRLHNIEGSTSAKDMAEYAKLLKDLQSHFDAYRNEAATDNSTLKDQVASLSRLNGELRTELSRAKGQVTLAHERYDMLQGNYAMLKSENNELQKRSQTLSESAARQDLRTQQVAEDLVETKGLLDSMRNETANLKAEKEFRGSVEKRLMDENEGLIAERARLNALHASLQNLLNEREHTEAEARRRLQGQIESLESELQSTKRKLSDEIDDGKKTALRREYETQQNQTRIEDLLASLGSVREDLIAARTTRDQLQARLDEMAIQLRSAEERAHALQPRPSSQLAHVGDTGAEGASAGGDESSSSREQDLTIQVSELKRDLELGKTEIDNLKSQVEQYKAISQSSEEELASLNDTQDQYRQEMDRLIEEKDSKIRELEQRVNDLSTELSATSTELSSLRTEQADSGRVLEDQKTTLEAEIAKIKDESERHAAAAHFHQEDLKVQAEIAQQAQQNYENELLKHADAAKILQKVRGDYNQLKIEVLEIKTEAETAKTNLSQSEEAWAGVKERFERELTDLRTSRDNVNAQNKRLHTQLEQVTSQISSLQKRRSDGEDTNSSNDHISVASENLQEIVRYLRQEKEIVDIQYSRSSEEAKRLQQRLDYCQSQLDETRLKLNQQRQIEQDSERSTLNHNKLIETINELNLFRESSVTLRSEARQAQTSLAEKLKQVEELLAQVQPLQEEIQVLKNDKETLEGILELKEADRKHWQERAQNILQKYDRVDPAELEALKEHVKSLETERDELIASKQALQQQVDSIPDQIKEIQEQAEQTRTETRNRLIEQSKARDRNQTAKLKDAVNAREALEQQISTLQQDLGSAREERDRAVEGAAAAAAQADAKERAAQDGSEEGQVDDEAVPKHSNAELQALRERADAAELRVAEMTGQIAVLHREANESQSKITDLENQITNLQQKLSESNAQLVDLEIKQQQQPQVALSCTLSDVDHEELNKLRGDLVKAQHEVESLKGDASINSSIAQPPAEDGSKSLAEQVTEQTGLIRAELNARHDERVQQAEDAFNKRAEAMKGQLIKKLQDGRDQYRQEVAATHTQEMHKLKSKHEVELQSLRSRHQEEMDELRRNEETKFEQFKEVFLAEHSTRATLGKPTNEAEVQTIPNKAELTDVEARELIANNPVIRGILMKNISTKVEKEKEAQQKILTETVAEIEKKAANEKEQAVMMESKKVSVKISMAENRAKSAHAKIEVVQQAATETPQRPVGEVWAIAKDAKPAVNVRVSVQKPIVQPLGSLQTTSGQTTQPTQIAQAQNQKQNSTFGLPAPALPSINPQNQQNTRSSGQPAPANPNIRGQQPLAAGSFGRPTPPMQMAANPPSQLGPSSQAPPPSPTQAAPNQRSASQTVINDAVPTEPTTNLLAKSSQPQNNQNNIASGPAALRSLQQSGIPLARGGVIPRASSNQGRSAYRAGRGGGGRGGPPQQVDIAAAQAQGQGQGRGSPTRGGLSATARQFVPQGNKRGRDDGEVDGAGDGKRIRGGGAGN